jgi:hypothetical protein
MGWDRDHHQQLAQGGREHVLIGERDPHHPVGRGAAELVEGERLGHTKVRLVSKRPGDPGLRGEREAEQLHQPLAVRAQNPAGHGLDLAGRSEDGGERVHRLNGGDQDE